MKKVFAGTAIILTAALLGLTGCGKNSANSLSESTVTNAPLPEPPVVVNCQPGIPGGRFIVGEMGDPKTFNPITANETSSLDITRFMFWHLLNYDVPSQTVEPGLAVAW